MGFLFGEPKIQGDGLRKCLAYLEEEWKLKAFQEKEADLYNNALVKCGRSISADGHAAKEMCRAANRLAQSASEILRRRGKMASIPDAPSAMYFAWQLTYSDYAAWATAQCAAIEAVANGMEPHGERVRELLSQSEKSRHEAEKEEKKLLKRLKLSGNVVKGIFNNASAAVEAEKWQPEEVLKENPRVAPKKEETTDKTEDIKKLESAIVSWALVSTKPINEAWASVTGEDPMSAKSNFIVRSEMLWFFLHMMDRYAFAIGGPEVRATLQDAIVESAIRGMLASSFDTTPAEKGFDSKEWLNRMASGGIEEFNEAQLDYSSCTTLGVEGTGDFAREETILGKLAARIDQLIGQELNIELRLVIWATAAEFLAKSGLEKQVEELIDKG